MMSIPQKTYGALFLLFLFVICIPFASAEEQIEVEEEYYYAEEEEISSKKNRAAIELSGIATSGNSNNGSIYFGSDIFYNGSNNWIHFNGNSYYAETSNIDARIMEGRLAVGHNFNERNYVFLMGTLKHDLAQHLDLRSSLGIGYGYALINVSYEELAIEIGVGSQTEDYDGFKDESFIEGRLGTEYILRLSKTAKVANKTEFLISMKNKKDYRVRSEFIVADALYKNIGMLIKATFDYDGSPIEPEVQKLDKRIFAGITFDFL